MITFYSGIQIKITWEKTIVIENPPLVSLSDRHVTTPFLRSVVSDQYSLTISKAVTSCKRSQPHFLDLQLKTCFKITIN